MFRPEERLPKKMKAVVCYGPKDYRLEEVPVPEAGPEDVVVRVLSAGICASDVKCYLGAPLFWGDALREPYCEPPVIPGHEFVGEVVALGKGAGEKNGLSIGDRVVSEQIIPCHVCRYCRRGQYWMCQVHNIYGFKQASFGAMAEMMKFPKGAINYKVPRTLSPEEAVFIEPLACSIHAVQRGQIEFGDTVVIAGCGPLGLGMVAAARMKNPGCLIAVDVQDNRLEVAKQCGADVLLNPRNVDVVMEVRGLTEGYGCDVYIEATGHPAAVEQGLHMIRKLGRFVEFSVMRELVTVDWTIIGDTKELDIYGSHLSPYSYPLAIDMLIKGKIPVRSIVTHQFPLEAYKEAFQVASSGVESIKVVLNPSA